MSMNKFALLCLRAKITLLISAFLVFLPIVPITASAQSSDLVTGPVNPAIKATLHGNRPPWALPERISSPFPADTQLEHLMLVLKRSPRQQQLFEQFLQQQQEPSSPNYHHWLTPVQVGKKFGASTHDIQAICAWLSSQGLQVNSVANSRMIVDFSGTASQINAAFAINLHYFFVNGERRMAPAQDPQIPTALSAVIHSVNGLSTVHDHSFHHAETAHVKAAGSDLPALTVCNSGCDYFVTPEDFSVIYDENTSYTGAGQTIAIIGRARVYDPDITNFQKLTGLPQVAPTVIVPPNGLDPGQPLGSGDASGDQVEATLDVMRAGSVAPGATVDLVISADNNGTSGLRIAAQYVVDSNPVIAQVMNVSFGACEFDRSQSDVDFWDSTFSQGAAEGISSFVASGDAGAAGCDEYFHTPPNNQVASPNYICSSSYDTCVGGTEFADASNPGAYWSQSNDNVLGSALGYIPEGGWNEPLNNSGGTQAAASGGGFSSFIPTPSWQTGTGVPGTQGRYTPDMAFTSAGHDGYFGCLAANGSQNPANCVPNQQGQFYFEYFFGTSAAAPDMAGVAALLDQKLGGPQGNLNPRLYSLAADTSNNVFHDVTVATSGVADCAVTTPSMCNNSTPSSTGLTGGLSGYLVTTGYDEVTGLGSIDTTNFLNNYALGTAATTTTLTSSLNPANLAAQVTFTATVATAGTVAPTGTVNFLDGSTTIGSGTLSTQNGAQVATFTTSSLAAGSHSITASYAGDSNNASSTSAALTQTITPPTFNWSANGSTSGTVSSGQSATYNFTVSPTGATTFAAAVTFSCSGLPDTTVTCNFNPSQIAAGSGATSVMLTMTTSGPNTNGVRPVRQNRRAENKTPYLWLPLSMPLVGIVMVGLSGKKPSEHSILACLGISLTLLTLFTACSNHGSNGVQVTPATAQVPLGGSQIFSASQSVTWSVSGPGSITSSGVYTAPTSGTTPATVTVTATPMSGTAGTASVTIPAVAVSIQSNPTSIYPNNNGWPSQTAQFTATVNNASNTAVTWAVTTANGGTIDANGLYTAPNIVAGYPLSVTVTATSAADTGKSGNGSETLKPTTVPGTYPNIMVTATESTTVHSVPVTLTVQ